MQDWSLGAGNPLSLTLAADFRFTAPDYVNDHIWELDIGGGEPAALALRTSYGLRARTMRLFPQFTENGKSVSNPSQFSEAPKIHTIYPNFIALRFSPFTGVNVTAEYWAPSSQVVTGRLTITNQAVIPHSVKLDWVGQLVPINGQSFSPLQMQSVTILAGKTENLAPVIFMTGGPQPGPGPLPSLMVGLDLTPGSSRTLTWVQAALGDHQASFDMARRTAARRWDEERGRIEMINTSDLIEVKTGDPDWDAAFMLAQKTAFSLFFGPGQNLPKHSFVMARLPDNGYSRRGDGFDYTHLWDGQPPLETYYLSTIILGAPYLTKGLLQNFLATQDPGGEIDCKPGIAGQRGKFLAAPLLATLAWKAYESTGDRDFLATVYPKLVKFFKSWLNPAHDRDGNSLPEWTNVLQTGFEDNPLFDAWHPWAQGAEISVIQSPPLASMIYREARTLVRIAEELGITDDHQQLKTRAGYMRAGIESCWDPERNFYCYADRDTHLSLPGKILSQRKAVPAFSLQKKLGQPNRLIIRVKSGSGVTPRPEIRLRGTLNNNEQTETLSRGDFQRVAGGAIATSRQLYDGLGNFETDGLARSDEIIIQTLDLTCEDHTLFLPLWAGVPNEIEAGLLVRERLLEADYFNRPFGVPALPVLPDPQADTVCMSVHLPWNQLIGEGLLKYGFRLEAARLVAHLMNAIIQNLKRDRAFYQRYHAEHGFGIGERNALSGLAPLGLFLETLGIQIYSPERVRLSGENPFPWPVTVKYRGLIITRQMKETEVTFPNGYSVTLEDPTDAEVWSK